jgi:hypothetical protein
MKRLLILTGLCLAAAPSAALALNGSLGQRNFSRFVVAPTACHITSAPQTR